MSISDDFLSVRMQVIYIHIFIERLCLPNFTHSKLKFSSMFGSECVICLIFDSCLIITSRSSDSCMPCNGIVSSCSSDRRSRMSIVRLVVERVHCSKSQI